MLEKPAGYAGEKSLSCCRLIQPAVLFWDSRILMGMVGEQGWAAQCRLDFPARTSDGSRGLKKRTRRGGVRGG